MIQIATYVISENPYNHDIWEYISTFGLSYLISQNGLRQTKAKQKPYNIYILFVPVDTLFVDSHFDFIMFVLFAYS